MSPPKPKKHVATAAPKALAKPGSVAKRHAPAPASVPRSLEKVLSNDQLRRRPTRRPSDVLARMRSATPATIPGLKREASEPVALGSIPNGDKSLKERSRNIISRSASSASIENSKAEKKAKTEADLKEAISALKKPNRQLAGISITEEAEKRVGSSSSPHLRSESSHFLLHGSTLILTSNFRIEEASTTIQCCKQTTGTSQGDAGQLPFQGRDAGSGPGQLRKIQSSNTEDRFGYDPVQLHRPIHST